MPEPVWLAAAPVPAAAAAAAPVAAGFRRHLPQDRPTAPDPRKRTLKKKLLQFLVNYF